MKQFIRDITKIQFWFEDLKDNKQKQKKIIIIAVIAFLIIGFCIIGEIFEGEEGEIYKVPKNGVVYVENSDGTIELVTNDNFFDENDVGEGFSHENKGIYNPQGAVIGLIIVLCIGTIVAMVIFMFLKLNMNKNNPLPVLYNGKEEDKK